MIIYLSISLCQHIIRACSQDLLSTEFSYNSLQTSMYPFSLEMWPVRKMPKYFKSELFLFLHNLGH